MEELRYIPLVNFKGPNELRGKEIYQCMNTKCEFKWRGDAGMQGTCVKCGSIYMMWINFYDEWKLVNDKWRRNE